MQVFLNDEYSFDDTSKEMIKPSKYYLSGRSSSINGEELYESERGIMVYGERNINWVGTIALMYPSDYIYTYAFGVDNICYNTPNNCKIDKSGAPSLGWIYDSDYEWTLAPNSSFGDYIFYISTEGFVGLNVRTIRTYATKPVLYLKPEVKIKQGDGTINNPYVFEL